MLERVTQAVSRRIIWMRFVFGIRPRDFISERCFANPIPKTRRVETKFHFGAEMVKDRVGDVTSNARIVPIEDRDGWRLEFA